MHGMLDTQKGELKVKTFKDSQGREWNLAVNVDAVKRARSLVNVDLLEVTDGKLLERIASDEVLMVDLVYVLVKPEADAKGVTDEEFGRAMAGDAIDAAYTAFMEELTSFFRNPARRALLKKALSKLNELEGRVLDRAEKRIDSGELDKVVEEALTTHGSSSGNSPASSESTPEA